jgi:co-chaperonin GroES (HSP10)
MKRGKKELLVVGDRVLIQPEKESTTEVGLLLPATAVEKEPVQGGRVVALGPGTPLPPPEDQSEPWKQAPATPRYVPMQPKIGDFAVFFRKAAIEITFEKEKYLVVPQGAILILVRDESGVPDILPDDV